MAGSAGMQSTTAGTNHPAGVQVHFYIPTVTEKDSVALRFYDSKDQLLKTVSSHGKKDKLVAKTGANLYNWNTELDGAARLPGMILWWANLSGPKAVPGNYRVELDVNGQQQSQPITIMVAPTSEATVANMQAQFTFVQAVNKTVDQAHTSIKNIRLFNEKLAGFKTIYGDRTEAGIKNMLKLADSMKTKFGDIEKALYQTQNRSGQDPLNFPIRLTNKLAHLNALVTVGDFAPTQQDELVRKELTTAIEKELATFNSILETDVKAFNEQFRKLELDYLILEKDKND